MQTDKQWMEDIINEFIGGHEEQEDGEEPYCEGVILVKCSGATTDSAPKTGEDGDFIVQAIRISHEDENEREHGYTYRVMGNLPTFKGNEDDLVIQIMNMAKSENFHLEFHERSDHGSSMGINAGTTFSFGVTESTKEGAEASC